MAALSTVALIVGAAALAGSTVNSIESSAQAKRETNRAKKYAGEDMARLEKEEKDRILEEDNSITKINTRDESLRRQRAASQGLQGRRGTILTSPLGDANYGSTNAPQTKSLLGV